MVIGDDSVTDFPAVWTDRAFGNFAGTAVPNTSILFAVLAVAFAVLLHSTPFGRSDLRDRRQRGGGALLRHPREAHQADAVRALGHGRRARGRRHRLRNSTAAANVGQGFELTAVAAVVLGGMSIFGGRGTIVGVVLALVLLGGIQKALTLAENISSYWVQIVTGALLVGSVLGPEPRRARVREARAGGTRARPWPSRREGLNGPRGGRMTQLARLTRVLAASLAVVALALAACGETKDDSSSSEKSARPLEPAQANAEAQIKKGLKFVSMPKQLGNPYEEIEHGGVNKALKEVGGANRIVGPTDASAPRRRCR